MSVGEFFAEHRKLIDGRKAHLTRVGITPPDVAPPRDLMPSQADVLVTPGEPPLLEATHKPHVPQDPPATYETPKLPKLLGVNETLTEE